MVERTAVRLAMNIPMRLSSFWRGDGSCFVVIVRFAIFPNSVLRPVANTMAFPDPWLTVVPMKTELLCSIFGRNLPLKVVGFL